MVRNVEEREIYENQNEMEKYKENGNSYQDHESYPPIRPPPVPVRPMKPENDYTEEKEEEVEKEKMTSGGHNSGDDGRHREIEIETEMEKEKRGLKPMRPSRPSRALRVKKDSKKDYDYYPDESLGGKYGDGYHDYSKNFEDRMKERINREEDRKRRQHEGEKDMVDEYRNGQLNKRRLENPGGGFASDWNETKRMNNKRADDGYRLVWSEEFDGNKLDNSKWNYEVNCDGGGNNELQCYTNKESNIQVRDGKLYVTARTENLNGRSYTSGRINTKGKASWKYGKFEARAKLPRGEYLWPALWMMPRDSIYGGWAASGEIDIMEARGQLPNQMSCAIHYGGSWPNNVYTGSGAKNFPFDLTADFHTYTAIWEKDSIQFMVDDKVFYTQSLTRSFYSGKGKNPYTDIRQPFDQPFFYIINLAIGGGFFGANANSLTVDMAKKWQNPQLVVDYIRVYQKGDNVNPNPLPNPNPKPSTTTSTSIPKTSTSAQKTSTSQNPKTSSYQPPVQTTSGNIQPPKTTVNDNQNQNQNDPCKNKCDGQLCCNDQKLGPVCYQEGFYVCPYDPTNGKQSLCPKGTGVCNSACYDQSLYCCRDGQIKLVSYQ